MCSAPAIPKTQFFYQKANQLGREAIYAAPKATTTILAVAPLALHMFQPEGILTQMLTLAATTGVVLSAPRIYNYVYNHPVTAQVCATVCAQPFVQQICQHPLVQEGTATVSSAIHDVTSFGSMVKNEVTSRLFSQANAEETYDEDDHQERVERKHFDSETKRKQPQPENPSVKNALTNQLDTLERAFKAVPTATAATLAVSTFALSFFQPEGLITQFFTLTAASGSFFLGTKLYGRYHNHPVVQDLWNHPVVKQVTDHPVTLQGTALVSQAVNKVSAIKQAMKAAYGRVFYPVAAQRPTIIPFPEFRQFLANHGGEETWEGFTIPEDKLQELYEALPELFSQENLPTRTTKTRVVTQQRRASPDPFFPVQSRFSRERDAQLLIPSVSFRVPKKDEKRAPTDRSSSVSDDKQQELYEALPELFSQENLPTRTTKTRVITQRRRASPEPFFPLQSRFLREDDAQLSIPSVSFRANPKTDERGAPTDRSAPVKKRRERSSQVLED